jgi:hypothetical protein
MDGQVKSTRDIETYIEYAPNRAAITDRGSGVANATTLAVDSDAKGALGGESEGHDSEELEHDKGWVSLRNRSQPPIRSYISIAAHGHAG